MEINLQQVFTPVATPIAEEDPADDAADAWGWGDDDGIDADAPADPAPAQAKAEEETPLQRQVSQTTREMTLSEKYFISSLPRAVYNTVEQVYTDGAHLTQPE